MSKTNISKMVKDCKKAIFCFGRMNPPTIGHTLVWDTMEELAQKEDCFAFIVPSHTEDSEENPISYKDKFKLIKDYVNDLCFAQTYVEDLGSNAWEVVGRLIDEGAKDIFFVCGSDRIEDFESLKNVDQAHVEIVQAGNERNDEGDLKERASSSLMREFAKNGKFYEYRRMCPDHGTNIDLAKRSYDLVRDFKNS